MLEAIENNISYRVRFDDITIAYVYKESCDGLLAQLKVKCKDVHGKIHPCYVTKCLYGDTGVTMEEADRYIKFLVNGYTFLLFSKQSKTIDTDAGIFYYEI